MASGSVRVEDGHAVIRVPLEDVHSLRVALKECDCKRVKSNATKAIRETLLDRISRALAAVNVGGVR